MKTLSNLSEYYSESMKDLFLLSKYPFFYRAGKAFAINSVLEGFFGECDYLVYADPGCELVSNFYTRWKLMRMLRKCNLSHALAESLNLPEWKYTKKSLLDASGLEENEKFTSQIQATYSIWKKNELTLNASRTWCRLSRSYFNYWQDPENIKGELDGFVAHRQDQSIMSVIWKLNKFGVQKQSRKFSKHFDFFRGSLQPIHTIRNRTGFEVIPSYYNLNLIAFLAMFPQIIVLLLKKFKKIDYKGEPPSGIEPETFALRERRSTD